MRIPNNVLAFAQANDSMSLVEKWQDYFNHYRVEFLGKKGSYDNKFSFEQKTKSLHEQIEKEIAKISKIDKDVRFSEAVWRTNPNYVWTTFAVVGNLVDMVIADTVAEDFKRFADVKSVGFGDNLSYDIKSNDLFLVTKAGNGRRHVFAQRQHNGQATLQPVNRMITVEEDLYRILSGKRNLAEYAIKIAQSMETELTYDIYAAIDDTYSALPAQFGISGFTQDDFVTLASRVKAFNGGARCTVFGTQLALSKVIPTSEYMKMAIGSEYINNGYIGTFMGTDLFELPQKAVWNSSTYAMKLDDTRLYFISTGIDKLVKIGIEGDTISYTDNMTTNANLSQTQTMQKRWAVGLISNAKYGIIDTGA
jgi:hypothetical protein